MYNKMNFKKGHGKSFVLFKFKYPAKMSYVYN